MVKFMIVENTSNYIFYRWITKLMVSGIHLMCFNWNSQSIQSERKLISVYSVRCTVLSIKAQIKWIKEQNN